MDTLLPGITAERMPTSRLTVNVLEVAGRDPENNTPVLFVHGNVSSSLFWQPMMLALPETFRPLAIDLRGFGDTDDEPVLATRGLLAHYVKPPHVPEHLDIFVESMLSTRVGQYNYPGDSRPVDAWPGFAPGDRGVLNTMAPTHFRIADLSEVEPKPPVLWLRGADDVIVSDTSLYDLAYLGSMGAIPGWHYKSRETRAQGGEKEDRRRRQRQCRGARRR